MLPRRIAFSGWMGAGKTETAKLLQEEGYLRLSFAHPLRKDFCAYFGIPYEDTFDPAKKAKYRRLLQIFGTEVARAVDKDWWVQRFKEEYASALAFEEARLVVDDVRFRNEADALREFGFVIVRLGNTRDRVLDYLTHQKGMSYDEAWEAFLHPSEHDLDSYDGFSLRINAPGPAIFVRDVLRTVYEPEGHEVRELLKTFAEKPPPLGGEAA